MKKYAVVSTLLLSTFAAAPVLANTTDWFVGGGVGYQNDAVKQDFGNSQLTSSKNAEGMTYQLRGGVVINDQHRVMGTYSYFSDDVNGLLGERKQTQNMFLASYDYLIPVHQNINLFAGVSAGFADNEFKNKATGFTADSTDFVWGGQVGAQYKINNNWSTDLTYRLLDQDYDKLGNEVDYTQQVVWSVDYKF
ncbi:porin family protein (plasmid) [Photobacterium sp. DA100]|uniref:porin family protein n=1 Tax=Photobacterium sp. DA100 TaxID=3027472 RepID=UPI00247B03F1|nr:porin family protein [Photobacterium sp. DA100]WEM45189.1 porin family protein [Photobacterium sp. DA100]